jgi:ribosomal protein S28E/S33
MPENTRIHRDGVTGDWLTRKVKGPIREGKKQQAAQRKGEMIGGDREFRH